VGRDGGPAVRLIADDLRDTLRVARKKYDMGRALAAPERRLLSGPGLFNIYRFLRDSGYATEPEWLRQRIAQGDPSAVISQIGLAGEHLLCTRALDLFSSVYGAEAGNLALKALAVGGVYVAGGIAPKILPRLQDGAFIHAFTDKGRLSDLMRSIEVKVALNPRAPLIGAAHYALRL